MTQEQKFSLVKNGYISIEKIKKPKPDCYILMDKFKNIIATGTYALCVHVKSKKPKSEQKYLTIKSK